MTIIDETTNGVAKTGVSRRHFIQGAAATAAGAALPVAGIVGAGSASAAGKTLRIATGKQVYAAAPWRTMDGSRFIIGVVGEWLCWQTPDFKLEPRIAESYDHPKGRVVPARVEMGKLARYVIFQIDVHISKMQ